LDKRKGGKRKIGKERVGKDSSTRSGYKDTLRNSFGESKA